MKQTINDESSLSLIILQKKTFSFTERLSQVL